MIELESFHFATPYWDTWFRQGSSVGAQTIQRKFDSELHIDKVPIITL